MKNLLMNFVFISLSIFLNHLAVAQSEEELQQAVESIESLTDNLGDNVGEIGESIEKLMEEHGEELEAWAEEYSGQWEQWAEQFESQFSRWAEVQEHEWEAWAEQYSSKWEEWAKKIESEDFNPEEMNELIQRNLKMLGDMPLGQMVDGMLKEGTEGLKSAPWDSLRDLQSMLQDSIKKSVADAERKLAKSADAVERAADGVDQDTIEGEAEFILPVINNQQEGIKAKQKIMADEARQALQKIERRLATGDIDSEDLKLLLQRFLRESGQEKQKDQEVRRQAARERELMAANNKLQHGKARFELELQARKEKENAERNSPAMAELRLVEALERIRQDSDSAQPNRDALKRMYNALAAQDQKIQGKNEELEALRSEIKQLRKEVAKMKSDRNRDN